MHKLNLDIPKKYQPFLRIGTCSWKYEGWKGLIYREGVKYAANDYLPDYVKYFNTVEVDQWFWSLFPSGVKGYLPSDLEADVSPLRYSAAHG